MFSIKVLSDDVIISALVDVAGMPTLEDGGAQRVYMPMNPLSYIPLSGQKVVTAMKTNA